jgi:hypothetical protein
MAGQLVAKRTIVYIHHITRALLSPTFNVIIHIYINHLPSLLQLFLRRIPRLLLS